MRSRRSAISSRRTVISGERLGSYGTAPAAPGTGERAGAAEAALETRRSASTAQRTRLARRKVAALYHHASREQAARGRSGSGAGPTRAEGVAIAKEALAGVAHRVAGAYIMPPFNRVDSALAILEVVRDRWRPATAPPPP